MCSRLLPRFPPSTSQEHGSMSSMFKQPSIHRIESMESLDSDISVTDVPDGPVCGRQSRARVGADSCQTAFQLRHCGPVGNLLNEEPCQSSDAIKNLEGFECNNEDVITETPVQEINFHESQSNAVAWEVAEDGASVSQSMANWRTDPDSLDERLSTWMASFPENHFTQQDAALSVGGDFNGQVERIRVSNDDLQEAIVRADMETLRRLVSHGASVNAPVRPDSSEDFMTLLHILSAKPDPPMGPVLVEVIKMRANLNARSSTGSTPLMYACMKKNLHAIEALLLSGADELPVDDDGRSALWHGVSGVADGSATAEACEEVVLLFAKYEADLDQGPQKSPIAQAVDEDNLLVAEALIKSGATLPGLEEALNRWPAATIEHLYSTAPHLPAEGVSEDAVVSFILETA